MSTAYSFDTGYVESSRITTLTLYRDDDLDGASAARELFRALIAHVREGKSRKVRACCKKSPEGSNYCPTCGNRLADDAQVFSGEVQDLLDYIWGADIDSISDLGLPELLEEHGFQFWSRGEHRWHIEGLFRALEDWEDGDSLPEVAEYHVNKIGA